MKSPVDLTEVLFRIAIFLAFAFLVISLCSDFTDASRCKKDGGHIARGSYENLCIKNEALL